MKLTRLTRPVFRVINPFLHRYIKDVIFNHIHVQGDPKRLYVHPTAARRGYYNTASGKIVVGKNVIIGHNVWLITGHHSRDGTIPSSGRDIIIGDGVWLCSNVTVIGPASVGENTLVSAGSVVKGVIPDNVIVRGNPAKVIKVFQ